MKMEKSLRTLSLILVLALSVCLLSSCGKGGTSSGSQSAAEPTQTATEAPAPATGEVAAEPEPAENATLEYFPRAETETLSYIEGYSPTVTNVLTVPDDLMLYAELEKRLNVHLEFEAIAASAARETFSVLIASNDLPDLCAGVSGSFNSLENAIADGIIMDLTGAVEEYMPNYSAVRLSDEGFRKASITDGGVIGAIYGFMNGRNLVEYGPVIRQDWLSELGLESPVTYDEYHDVLTAFKSEYDASCPIFVSRSGFVMGNYLSAGYGVAWDTMMGTPVYVVVDGEVKYSPIEDGFKAYVTMLHQWYDEGLISRDFMSSLDDVNVDGALVGSDDVGIFYAFAAKLPQFYEYSEDPDFELAPLKDARVTADQVNHLRKTDDLIGLNICVGGNCENLELACRWLDYKFTDEGWLLHNYGLEDVSFKYNAQGEPELTEVIYANPDGLSSSAALQKYCQMNGAFLIENKKRMSVVVDMSYNNLWSQDDNSYFYDPSMYYMTPDESAVHGQYYSDIETYVSECVVNFILGNKPLSEWDDYVAQIQELGIDKCIEARQGAVDRYATR